MQSSDMCIVDGGPAPAAANSIWHWLKQGIDLDPTAPALQASHVPADYLSNLLIASKFDAQCHNFSWSYAQLEEAAYTLAAHLVSRGIGPGDVIVTVLSDSVEWAIFFWAAIQLGAMFVPLNPWLVSKPDELRYLITVAEGTVLITNEPRAVEEIDLVTNRSQDPYKVKMMCHMGGSAVQGWEHLRQVICDRSAAERLTSRLGESPATRSNSIALLMFTSGTTDQPKGCPISSTAFAAQCDGYRAGQLGKWDNTSRFLVTSPNFYATCWLGSFTTWRSGGCVVLMPQSSGSHTSAILIAICDQEITHLFTYPTYVKAMIKDPLLQQNRPHTLRFVNVTGDMVNRTLVTMCKQELRAENVVSLWGMTEGAAMMNWTSTRDIVPFTGLRESELVGLGRILPGAKARICYRDTYDPVKWGEIGDLHVCGVNFITSYLNGRNPETFYQDDCGCTWLITCDRARICRDGIMYLMGREKDVIRGFYTDVIPGILEALLRNQEWVEECQVVGAPTPDSVEVPVAIVFNRSRYTMPPIQVLNEVIKSQLESEYALNAVYSLTELGFDKWPVNSTGKIMKRILKEAVLKKRAQC